MSSFSSRKGFRYLTTADLKGVYKWIRDYVTSVISDLPTGGSDGNGIYDGSGSVPESTVAEAELLSGETTGIYFGSDINDVKNLLPESTYAPGTAMYAHNNAPALSLISVSPELIGLNSTVPPDGLRAEISLSPYQFNFLVESDSGSSSGDFFASSVVIKAYPGDLTDDGSSITLDGDGVFIDSNGNQAPGENQNISVTSNSIRINFNKSNQSIPLIIEDKGIGQYISFVDNGNAVLSVQATFGLVYYEDYKGYDNNDRWIPDVGYIRGLTGRYEDATAANAGGVVVGEVWFNTTTNKYMVRLS